jgi:hypothetical protein
MAAYMVLVQIFDTPSTFWSDSKGPEIRKQKKNKKKKKKKTKRKKRKREKTKKQDRL